MGESINSLKVIVNEDKIFNFNVQPKFWITRHLCNSINLKSLLIICDNKIIYNKIFTNEDSENLKKNAYLITNNEN
jgi:hypothetical protein